MRKEREIAIKILDMVEDYLYENKDKLMKENNLSDKSIIHGEDYYELEDKIVDLLK